MADLANPDLYATGDPHRVWRWLRAHAPVYWNEEADGPGFWAITAYEPAIAVYRDAASFSSASGSVLRADRRTPDPGGGKMLVLTDPPRHRQVRAIVNRAFTPRSVTRLARTIEHVAADLVGEAVAGGRCEFVDAVAARLPVAVTCDLMGVPRRDWGRMYELTRRAFGSDDPALKTSASSRLSAAQAHSEIMLYYRALLDHRRRQPADDLVSTLAAGTVEGRRLTTKEILLHCDNLLVAGHETVRHATAGGLLALIEHPAAWQDLVRAPNIMDSAVEEILRWTSPALHVLRTARRDVTLGDHKVRAGDAVTIWNGSVNRDERAFSDPDRFDIHRRPNRHLALGLGPHYCLGASLARLQIRAVMSSLVRAVRDVAVAGPVVRLRSNVVAGYRSMPVELRPR